MQSIIGLALAITLAVAGIAIAIPELFFWMNSTTYDIGHDWAALGFFVSVAMVFAAGVCSLLLRKPKLSG